MRTIDLLPSIPPSTPPPNYWGSSRQYRHMPWSEIELVTSQCTGWCSTKLSHTGQGNNMLLDLVICDCIFSPGRKYFICSMMNQVACGVSVLCQHQQEQGDRLWNGCCVSGGLYMQHCCPDRVVKIKWDQYSYSKCKVCHGLRRVQDEAINSPRVGCGLVALKFWWPRNWPTSLR